MRRIAWRSISRIRCGIGGGGLAASAGAAVVATRRSATRVFFIVLESCSSGEVENLRSVVTGLDVGKAQIDLQRTEGRLPAKAEASRRAEGEIVLDAGLLCTSANDIVHAAQSTE